MPLMENMLAVAGRGPRAIGDKAGLARDFVEGCRCADGGFRGRALGSDLYYTVFGLACLSALGAPLEPDRTIAYLRPFAGGEGMDLVHLASLARCWAIVGSHRYTPAASHASATPAVSPAPAASDVEAIVSGIERHRCSDGGYFQLAGSPAGSAYGCFLAVGAYQDLRVELPDADGIDRCLASLVSSGGGYGNFHGAEFGSVPATAAAIATRLELAGAVDPAACDWLAGQCTPTGGWSVSPRVPENDLLSTATAIYTLASVGRDLSPIADRCRWFVDAMWHPAGGYRSGRDDEGRDCEYTFYGLLAMGVVAPAADGR